MPERVTPQQLLQGKVTSSGRAGTPPQHARDGPKLLAALPKRAEPPALHAGLAKSPTQLACGEWALGEGGWAWSIGLLQAQGLSQPQGLPVPKVGSVGLLY